VCGAWLGRLCPRQLVLREPGLRWEGTGSASVTMTGNRIEWNRQSGILVAGGSHYNVTGNYIDRSGGPGITLAEHETGRRGSLSITGNVIYRSGKWAEAGTPDSAADPPVRRARRHADRQYARRGAGRRRPGPWSPSYGIIIERLGNSVVKET